MTDQEAYDAYCYAGRNPPCRECGAELDDVRHAERTCAHCVIEKLELENEELKAAIEAAENFCGELDTQGYTEFAGRLREAIRR